MAKMDVRLRHEEGLSKEEMYEQVAKLYKATNGESMHPDEWLEQYNKRASTGR